MKAIIISQPMFFPWAGLFEQIRLSDIYVHFDDVQLPQGRSFVNRVQLKCPMGSLWMTVPLRREGRCLIKEAMIDQKQDWRSAHLKTLGHLYSKAIFFPDMIKIVQEVYSLKTDFIYEINIFAIERIASYFGITKNYVRSSDFKSKLKKSDRLLEIIKQLGGKRYITGHGARNYLDHELFEKNGVQIEYMNYQRKPYHQLYEKFNPHVSVLDLIANAGKKGAGVICSSTVGWREFLEKT